MKINLTDAEKTALANHLAEKRIEDMFRVMSSLGTEALEHLRPDVFKREFEFYDKALKETDDY